MFRFIECLGEDVLMVEASGELTLADHVKFLTHLESVAREYGQVRVLCELNDLKGMEVASAWQDPTFGLRDKGLVKRFAVVGEEQDRRWLRPLSEPFTEVKFYPRAARDDAYRWVAEGAEEESDHARISRLAYAKWEAAGRPPDEEARFWREAEQELRLAPVERPAMV
jgi:hypothetical protein